MHLNGRLWIVILISCVIDLSNGKPLKRSKSRHFFTILGYLHGYKIGQNLAINLPPLVPIIVVPLINQQQTVSIQKATGEQNYQEKHVTQNIIPARLISSSNNESEKDDNEISRPNSKKIQLDLNDNEVEENMDEFRQAIDKKTTTVEITTANEPSTTTPETIINTTLNAETNVTMLETNITTVPDGTYPNPMYNNEMINTLTFTMSYPESNFGLPPIHDNRWQNFSSIINTTANINTSSSTPVYEMGYPTESREKGPYTRAWYNNALIDQLSITTNSYTNNELPLPPAEDDRWSRFASLNSYSSPGEFKPLAGLYYDGFLHSPIKKEYFQPYNNYV